jgi:heme/copper-type cytochrome/quinol oxidase subunit 4
MATAEASKSGGIGKDLVVYVCLLALAGFQFALAFENIDTSQMLVRMLAVAIVEAGLAVMFFMHLWTEKKGFAVFVLVFTIFVLLALQYGWTDSTRMVVGAPFSK